MPAFAIPFLAWAATVAETSLGIGLILGLWPRWVALGAALLLAMFGISMAISFGVKSPMDYSVFSASSGAILLALYQSRKPSEVVKTFCGSSRGKYVSRELNFHGDGWCTGVDIRERAKTRIELEPDRPVRRLAGGCNPRTIWAASFLFIAEGLKSIGPNGVTFVRLFIGFATLALFPAARKPVEWSAWPGIAVVGVLWFAFPLSIFRFA